MSKKFSFSTAPVLKRKRSFFDLSHRAPTTMSVGTLYPILVQEVYPGDTFKIKANVVMQTTSAFVKPVIDNLYAEVHYFFVPNRTVCEWEKVMGENKSTAWAPSSPTSAPIIDSATSGVDSNYFNKVVEVGDVAERMGLPLGIQWNMSAIPFRAFAKIYDEWFRDQNNIAPMNIQKGGTAAQNTTIEKINHEDWSPNNYTGKLPHVARLRDYFSTALPQPQKGDPVSIAGGNIPARLLPVANLQLSDGDKTSQSLFPADVRTLMNSAGYTNYTTPIQATFAPKWSTGSSTVDVVSDDNYLGVYDGITYYKSGGGFGSSPAYMVNAAAYDPGASVASVSINELRYAIAAQRLLEIDAIGGTRYAEQLLSHWGVLAPDQRLQRSEYLGGRRFPVSIQQVAQTAPASGSYVGQLGAYSLTNGDGRMLKGFVEHGYLFGVMFIRQMHTYSQGVEKFWFRRDRADFYDPVWANIGFQPIYKKELFCNSKNISIDNSVFGYGEAWQDLRFRQNRVTGLLRPDATGALDMWTFADDYANAPSLNQSFVEEDATFVDRTLQVPSTSMDQFVVDIWFDEYAYRVMPTFSTPGMLGV